MNSIFLNIKNLLPYLLLIVIYFFLVNIEANKNHNYNKPIISEKDKNFSKTDINNINSIVNIPVIPFKDKN